MVRSRDARGQVTVEFGLVAAVVAILLIAGLMYVMPMLFDRTRGSNDPTAESNAAKIDQNVTTSAGTSSTSTILSTTSSTTSTTSTSTTSTSTTTCAVPTITSVQFTTAGTGNNRDVTVSFSATDCDAWTITWSGGESGSAAGAGMNGTGTTAATLSNTEGVDFTITVTAGAPCAGSDAHTQSSVTPQSCPLSVNP